jgi:hypothetical protein
MITSGPSSLTPNRNDLAGGIALGLALHDLEFLGVDEHGVILAQILR